MIIEPMKNVANPLIISLLFLYEILFYYALGRLLLKNYESLR